MQLAVVTAVEKSKILNSQNLILHGTSAVLEVFGTENHLYPMKCIHAFAQFI